MVVAACVLCLSWAAEQANWIWCGFPSAVLWKDQLFVSTNGRFFGALGGLSRGTFTPHLKEVKSPVWHYTQMVTHCTNLAKLEIRDGRLLFFTAGQAFFYVVPMEEVPALEANEFGEAIGRARGYLNSSALLDRHSGETGGMLFPSHRKPDIFPPPLPGLTSEKPADDEYNDRAGDYWRKARCDIQIAGAKSVRLFHAHKGKLFVSVESDFLRVWYYDKDNNPIKNAPIPDRQLRTCELPADFIEYFAAYTSEKRDYLVTPNGKAYMSVPKGKAELEVTKVWDDPNRKIVGVVQDQANDAVYGWGFVTDSAAPERFYVKLQPKPVAVEYKRTVPLWNDRSDAYLESYECARAFRKAAEKK